MEDVKVDFNQEREERRLEAEIDHLRVMVDRAVKAVNKVESEESTAEKDEARVEAEENIVVTWDADGPRM
jgi:hypothetical protein